MIIQNKFIEMMNRLYEGVEVGSNQYTEMRKAFFFGYIDCFAYLTENVLDVEEENIGRKIIYMLTKEIREILSDSFDWGIINE